MMRCPSHPRFVLLCLVAMTTTIMRAPLSPAGENHSEHAAAVQSTDSTGSQETDATRAGATASVETNAIRHRQASLDEVLEFAKTAYARIDREVNDYTCNLYRRELVDGEDQHWQMMALKIRHEKKENDKIAVPLSVYLRFLKPKKLEGRAVIYVRNQNNGDLIGRRGGRRNPSMTVQLAPTSPMAMEGNRYPITEIGFKNLAKRLIEVLEQEMEYRDGELEVWENAKVGDRKCTHYRLTHHEKRPNLTYHMAEVSVDDELGIPIRYGAYDFPKEEGGKPQLLEQYVYTDVAINVGLTDKDFDPRNPSYDFQLPEDLDVTLTKD